MQATCRKHGPTNHLERAPQAPKCIKCTTEAGRRLRARQKAILVSEAGGACSSCGYDKCLAALEFHHTDPASKSFNVSRWGGSLKKRRAEAAKCILLCANCHREAEWKDEDVALRPAGRPPGFKVIAGNAAKTHCPQGHPYKTNAIQYPKGRVCRICRDKRNAARRKQ